MEVQIWYNTGFNQTIDGPPAINEVIPTIEEDTPPTILVNLKHNFPNEDLSYCYFVHTIIYYDDGTCCEFYDVDCINRG